MFGFLAFCLASASAQAQPVTLYDGRTVAGIVHDTTRPITLAAELLAGDLAKLTGKTPPIATDIARCPKLCIVIGQHDSALVRAVAQDAGIDLSALTGQWERHDRVALRSKRDPSRRYLLIAGSDPRGTIWGVIDLTRELGVSAWEWWADVTPRRVARLTIDGARKRSDPPSVQYRGIFLNDEDWGLQPWAAKTYEPETGDIGPKTYARIFELMWRLKANLIWPAMHDSTKPFYQIPGNAEAARDHAIVVGTSHAEPMMRNNVREWDEAARGPFDFFANRARMTDYWRERVAAVTDYENIYSVGLRGKHDSAMEGATTPAMARDATAQAIAIQRDLLAQAQGRSADTIPQALTLYKEVLDIYGTGLRVPDDVTLIWPDDNYGYIKQLPTPAEAARRGGSGVYYHLSYWGRPHDYLWLATTHPALIREQMGRAWATGARRIWVANVGDIKPGEYLTQYFLDLAFDARALEPTAQDHLDRWMAAQFGAGDAREIAAILTEYYDLAWERRPEFMGFSQTEPTRPIRIGDYVRTGGDEAQARIDRYAALVARAEAVAARLPADRADAYFQLVLYPVRGAASLNIRNLTLDLAALRARQGLGDVNALSDRARAAHARIVTDTAIYNAGKWRFMMDMAPRRLPVFAEPVYPKVEAGAGKPVPPAVPSERILSLTPGESEPAGWERVAGLGSRGVALRSRLDLAAPGAPFDLPFRTPDQSDVEVRIVALPVHPLTSANGLRIRVQIDDGAIETLDFATHGRSDEWKQNVLSNSAVRSIRLPQLAAGAHRVRLRALDPGFVLDRIDIRPDGAPDYYGAPPLRPAVRSSPARR
ncbi:MAG: glycosyl hydrolase 115 family protein [Pseudomonadota bacterium]